ncbi:DMT family transporter [Sneathiella sp. P13V-1]|uniref:DMT family transporter n=1 Tax=Sneathiella sp. P13V-1 TaxID=2697366 RepID=UPI002AAF5709|nr:DMT family transporter [Sneathiella sp. P13V-1]
MPIIQSIRGNQALQGVLWMVISTFMFALMTGIVRYIGSSLPSIEAAFIRYLFGVLLILPSMIKFWQGPLIPVKYKTYALRGFLHGVGVLLWFYAMARIPMAEVTAIGYVSPIFVTLGAALFLGEKLRIRRVMGVLVGLLGTFLILRPGFQEINLGQLAQLCAAPLFATSFLIAKRLTDTDNSTMIVGMLSLGCTVTLLPGAIYQWQTPTVSELGWLALTAVFATIGHYTVTKAFQAAPITLTQPIGFLQLVWAASIGYIVFTEVPDQFVMLGGAIIVAATTYISHRELKLSRQQKSEL